VEEVRIPPHALPDEVVRTILREAAERFSEVYCDHA
jgi:hypothetical protein